MACIGAKTTKCHECLREKNRSDDDNGCGLAASGEQRVYEPRAKNQYHWCDDETLDKLIVLANKRLIDFESKKEKKGGNTICISPDDETKEVLKSAGIILVWKNSQ